MYNAPEIQVNRSHSSPWWPCNYTIHCNKLCDIKLPRNWVEHWKIWLQLTARYSVKEWTQPYLLLQNYLFLDYARFVENKFRINTTVMFVLEHLNYFAICFMTQIMRSSHFRSIAVIALSNWNSRQFLLARWFMNSIINEIIKFIVKWCLVLSHVLKMTTSSVFLTLRHRSDDDPVDHLIFDLYWVLSKHDRDYFPTLEIDSQKS